MNYFSLKQISFLSGELQIILILFLFIATVIHRYINRNKLHKSENQYSVHFSHMFAPIYEELIFRGLIFQGFLTIYPFIKALIISSLLFGIWHIKNIFVIDIKKVMFQTLYAGLVFGPIVATVVYFTHTIWLGVIIHYINNLWVHYQWDVYKKIRIYRFVKRIKNIV